MQLQDVRFASPLLLVRKGKLVRRMRRWLLDLCSPALARRGWALVRRPKALCDNPKAILELSFDLVLCRYLMQVTHTPELVQVGAFDGIAGDPIHQYIKRGLVKGCLIEPQGDVFERLRATYAQMDGVRLKGAAISERSGQATMYRIRPGTSGPSWLYQIASFRLDVLLKHSGCPDLEQAIITEAVPTITFEDLVAEIGTEPDIVVIDTEGYDFEVVKLLNVRVRKPHVILYESKHLSTEDQNACIELLIGNGYRVAVLQADTVAYLDE